MSTRGSTEEVTARLGVDEMRLIRDTAAEQDRDVDDVLQQFLEFAVRRADEVLATEVGS